MHDDNVCPLLVPDSVMHYTFAADVVSIPKTGENFRLLYDTKGRFRLHSIRDDEAKVCIHHWLRSRSGFCMLFNLKFPRPFVLLRGLSHASDVIV